MTTDLTSVMSPVTVTRRGTARPHTRACASGPVLRDNRGDFVE